MALFETIKPLYVLSGFAVGFLVGMTGVGGGSLMTPLLILLFHVHPVTAVGTDLIYASVTKTGGSCCAWPEQDHRLAHRAPPGAGQPARLAPDHAGSVAAQDRPGRLQRAGHQDPGRGPDLHRAGAAVPPPPAGQLFPPRRRV